MGREIKRVPLDFVFPIDASYHDAAWGQHTMVCARNDGHENCGGFGKPPTGEGWQLWQTVSDGPISPVFDTPEKLIEWMCVPTSVRGAGPWGQGWARDVATPFVMRQMSAPSFVLTCDASGRETLQTGAEAFVGKVAP